MSFKESMARVNKDVEYLESRTRSFFSFRPKSKLILKGDLDHGVHGFRSISVLPLQLCELRQIS